MWHNVALNVVRIPLLCSQQGLTKTSQKIMKILNVAEKNDAAKNIADILSGGRFNRREGLSKYNKIYEFPLMFCGSSVTMVMTSVSGHLLNYDFPQMYRSWHASDPLILFDAPVVKSVGKDGEKIKETIQREARACQKLIIWTDCDREGENIGFEVINVCQEVKPNMEVLRAKFSEITPAAIRRAIAQLTRPDHRVSEAVDARQELDLRIGAAFTRFQTLRLRRVFPQTLSDQLISYGSCQFPTLGFVVERFREVDRFVSEPFWRIVVSAERNGKSVDFQWKRGRLFDEDCCRAYYEHLLENRYGQIVEVTKRPKSKWRPVALDTVELEKLATRKLRIGAKAAMQIAERLYTQGYISYPRTETNIFPPDMDLAALVRAQLEDSRWSGFATRVLEHGPNPRNGKSTDKAHPPIHPLKPGPNLQANEARLYELITRHFLACLSADAQGAETVILLCVGKPSIPRTSSALMSSEEGELFEAKGLVILQPNYLEVYPYDRWTERDIPDFHLADWILPTNVEMLAGQTSPPPLLTEADLISLMERHGIGTDATHADHIETIKQRLYVGVEQAKFLVPGQLGMGLVEGYDTMGLEMSKPHLRAELEADLKLICEGRKSKDDVLQYHLQKYKNLFQRAVRMAIQLDQSLAVRLEQPAVEITEITGSLGEMASLSGHSQSNLDNQSGSTVARCPSCGRSLVLRQRRPSQQQQRQQHPLSEVNTNQVSIPSASTETNTSNSWFLSCTGFPLCRYAVWFPDCIIGVRIASDSNNLAGRLCPRCASNSTTSDTSSSGDIPSRGPLKLAFRLRRNMRLPNGYMQDEPSKEYITCIFCDEDFRTSLGIRIATVPTTISGQQQIANQPAQPFSPTSCSSGVTISTVASTRSAATTGINGLSSSLRTGSTRTDSRSFSTRTTQSSSLPVAGAVIGSNNSTTTFPSLSDWATGSTPLDDNESVVCHCGQQAIVLTVKKAGPNQGRLFYRCAGGMGSSCDFFQWKTAAPLPGDVRGPPPLASSTQFVPNPREPNLLTPVSTGPMLVGSNPTVSIPPWSPSTPTAGSSGLGQSVSDTSILCRCGDPAKLLRVTKPTPNQGREFYTCPNGRPGDNGCNFFMWADSADTRARTPLGPATDWSPSGSSSSVVPGFAGHRRSTGRAGRATSAIPADNGGGVSLGHVPLWPPPASTGLRNSFSQSRRARDNSTRTPRRCGLCGEPGHTRTRCPRAAEPQ